MAGILKRIFRSGAEDPNGMAWLARLRGGMSQDHATGVNVSSRNAMRSSVVYACVRLLSETLASLPIVTYKRLPVGKARAPEFYLYGLLHDLPNPEMTSFELREALLSHLILWGNAYANLEYGRDGNITAIWPLRPDRTEVRREAGELMYYTQPTDGEWRRLRADEVWHIRNRTSNGLVGISPITEARQSIALSLAAEEFGARFYGNNARPGVILTHPGKLDDDAYERLKASWRESHEGLENAHRAAILEEGIQVKEIGIPPQDAQFLQTRQFQTEEIARIFRVPPHMIGDLSRSTFSNIEHQAIDFVTHTIRPWAVRVEQSIARCLLTQPERAAGIFVEFVLDGLLRGDLKSRYDAYAIGKQWGWLNSNEIRELENLNPFDGGEMYLSPMNMVPADQLGEKPDPPAAPGVPADSAEADPPPAPDQARASLPADVEQRRRAAFEVRAADSAANRSKLQKSHARAYRDALGRILKRESRDLKELVKKHLKTRGRDQFMAEVDQFYRDYQEHIRTTLKPVAMPYADAVAGEADSEVDYETDSDAVERWMDTYLDSYALRHGLIAQEQLRKIIARAIEDGGDVADAVNAELDQWPEGAESMANDESVRAGNGVALFVYRLAKVTQKRWFTVGDNCPWCNSLSGKVVGIDEMFVRGGTDWHPEGADEAMHVSRDFGHAPAHRGCNCMIGASL